MTEPGFVGRLHAIFKKIRSPEKRGQKLRKLLASCDKGTPADMLALREAVIGILEAHHLRQLYEDAGFHHDEQIETDDVDPLIVDRKCLLQLWNRAKASPDENDEEEESSCEDTEDENGVHPCYEPDGAEEEVQGGEQAEPAKDAPAVEPSEPAVKASEPDIATSDRKDA